MGSLERRIASLETANSGGGWDAPPCDECGWRGPDDNSKPSRFVFMWVGTEDFERIPTDEDGEPKEFCQTCGRKLVWFISWDDEHPGVCFYFTLPKTETALDGLQASGTSAGAAPDG
jgi:hypothetical protein